MNDFVGYCLDFYGQRGIYKDFFKPIVTKEEVEAALKIRQAQNDPPFDGDSFDRELVRDIMFARRGIMDNLEYPKVVQWVKGSHDGKRWRLITREVTAPDKTYQAEEHASKSITNEGEYHE